jgi:hypothetical protein
MEYLHSQRIDGKPYKGITEAFTEIGADRFGKRAVYLFIDGRRIKVGRWRKFSIKYKVGLGDQPWPATYEDLIEQTTGSGKDMRFSHTLVDKQTFEREWKRAKYAWRVIFRHGTTIPCNPSTASTLRSITPCFEKP